MDSKYKIVPVEPTPEQIRAGVELAMRTTIDSSATWSAYMADLYRIMTSGKSDHGMVMVSRGDAQYLSGVLALRQLVIPEPHKSDEAVIQARLSASLNRGTGG